MSRQAKFLILACAAAALGFGPAAVRAGIVTPPPIQFTQSFGNPTVLDFTQTVNLPKFDTSLGVLDSVTLTLNGTLEGGYTAFNPANGAQKFGIYSFGEMSLTGPDNLALAQPLQLSIQQTVTLQAHQTITDGFVQSTTGAEALTVPGAAFGDFEGFGAFAVTVQANKNPQPITIGSIVLSPTASVVVPLGAQGGGSVNQAGYGTVMVSYLYHTGPVVPEPAGVALLASGGRHPAGGAAPPRPGGPPAGRPRPRRRGESLNRTDQGAGSPSMR